MTNEKTPEEERAPETRQLRPYEAPAVRDFFQPLVVLGTSGQLALCATPKPPKH